MADTGRLDELKRKFDENPKRYFAPLANEYRKAGEPDTAIELCRTYLPQQPTHMSGYIVYGQALQDAGHTDESVAVFKQALTLDPENIIALRNLGDIARDAGDSAGAMRWYGKVLEMDPRNEEIAAYINSIASPGTQPVAPVSERRAPPTIRPEPEPDESAVRLEDIFAAPDMVQMPIVADEPPQDLYDASMAEESDQPFEVAQWPSTMDSELPDISPALDESPVAEGPWHASEPTDAPVEQSFGDEPQPISDENVAATEDAAGPLRFSDYMPEEDAAFAPTAEELGEPTAETASETAPTTDSAPDSAPPAVASVTPAAPATPVTTADSSPFVTETMAELYMRQGLRDEALAIYRQLALKRNDPALHKRIAEIEADNAVPSAGETVRAFFARIGARSPNERVELAADRDSSLSALFGSTQPNAGDVSAAERLSGAFGNPRTADSQS